MNEITSSELIESKSNPRVFRIKKNFRNSGLLLLIFFLIAGIGTAYGIWIDAPPDRIYDAAFVFLFFSLLSTIGLWILLAYKYESLTIQNKTIVQQGVIFRKEIDLSSVKQTHWNLGNIGMNGIITLKSLNDKISIHLDNFEPDERLWLIRYFQSTLPEDIQHHWDLFCSRIAIPLRDYNPDGILITRNRWTTMYIPIIFSSSVVSLIAGWKLQSFHLVFASVIFIIVFHLFLTSFPSKGSDQKTRRLMNFLGWWFTVAVIVSLVFMLTDFPEPKNTIAGFCSVFVWMVIFIFQLCLSSRRIQQKDLEKAKGTVKIWNSEVGPQAEE